MIKQNTQPGLPTLLSNAYTNGTTRDQGHNLPWPLEDAVQLQDLVGGQALLEGCLVPEWTCVQQSYYIWQDSRKTGRRWITSLITKLWNVAWDQWDHRRRVLHDSDSYVTREQAEHMELQIRREKETGPQTLPDEDRRLFAGSLESLLSRDFEYQTIWLHRTSSARERDRKRTQEAWGPQQELMMNWLRR